MRLERIVRRVVGEVEEELVRAMAADELRGFLGEHVGQIAAVGARDAAVAIEPPLPIRLPSAAEARELVEAAAIRMVARIERAVVPLADQAGYVARALQEIRDRAFAEREPVQTAHLERVEHAGAMRIAAGEKRRSRGRAHRRRRIMLRQAEPLARRADRAPACAIRRS